MKNKYQLDTIIKAIEDMIKQSQKQFKRYEEKNDYARMAEQYVYTEGLFQALTIVKLVKEK